MVNSRNTTIFWLCATLALAIALGSIGLGIVYDATTHGYAPGRARLSPGGGLLALLLSIGFLAIVFRQRWLATGLAFTVLISASIFSALAILPATTALKTLAITPTLLLVTTLIAISVLAAVWWSEGSKVGMAAAMICLPVGLLSLGSQWYPELSGFSLGSLAESNVMVSPLVVLCAITLPFLHQVFHRQIDISYQGLLVVGAIGIVITTFGWHFLRLQHSDQVLERAQTLASQLEASSVATHSVKLALIRRLAERWELLEGLPPPAFLNQEVDSYLRDFPELRLLTVLDPKQRPVMTKSRELEDRFWLHDFMRQPGMTDWLNHVVESRGPHLSRPQHTSDGRAHAAIAMPITPLPDISWTLIAVVDLNQVFRELTQHLDESLSIRVTAYGLTIYDQAEPGQSAGYAPLLSHTVKVHHDTEWTLHISMPDHTLSPDELYLPPLMLFSGLTLSFLLMLSQVFWRESERRSESLQVLNNTLNYHLEQERALRFTNERILEFSKDILCSISRDGTFLQISPACEDILGYTPEELQGQNYDLLLVQEDRAVTEQEVLMLVSGDRDKATGFRTHLRHKDGHVVTISWTAEWSRADNILFCVGRDISNELMAETLTRERIAAAVQTCIDTGIPFDEELQIKTAKGRVRWVRAIGHGVKDGSGKIARLQGAFQDITASRQTMEQIRRYAERQAAIFESITDAFFTLDRGWRFTYVNHRSEELLQKSRSDLLGQNVWEMFPAAVGTIFEDNYRHAVESGNSVAFEAYYQPLDLWLEISAYPSDEGLAVYYRSIGERKEAQWKLEATLQELERSNRELQDFAFVASHDLQEPLRKIQAFSDRLISRSEKLDEQEKDYLQRMQSAAGRMQKLIEDLLSYSRITTRAKSMVVCDMQTILNDVLQDMETSISHERAKITVGELPPTHGDATQLRQVLQNLLSNAIKFHAPGQPPEIMVAAEEVSGSEWTLVVSDNGIGFEERYAEKLFHPFQRLHQKDGYAGTGIGMAIVKKILDRHGASITVTSKPGSGTSFRIRFKQG